LKLSFVPVTSFSSPDGSCLFFVQDDEQSGCSRLHGFHSASFGASPTGFSFALHSPDWLNPSITSFGGRSNPYIMAWSKEKTQIMSRRLVITTSLSEFSIKGHGSRSKIGAPSTRHNCLIDIHAEVWFPISSTIKRSSPALETQPSLLCFVGSCPDKPFRGYFSNLIRQFEQATQKPTDNKLAAIKVESRSAFVPDTPEFSTTRYVSGKWLVELLCLIPIHIAITTGNRLIPLIDGTFSTDLETRLLGADVTQIANRLVMTLDF
jgi:hypothetical protein